MVDVSRSCAQTVSRSAVKRVGDVVAEDLLKKMKKPQQKKNLKDAIASMNAMLQVRPHPTKAAQVGIARTRSLHSRTSGRGGGWYSSSPYLRHRL
jgi:hypothetical protein